MKKVLILAPFLVLISSCGLIYMLFNPLKWAESDGGFVKFETVSEEDLGFLVFAPAQGSADEALDVVETEVKKTTGLSSAPFGIIFANDAAGNFIAFLINQNGEYGVYEVSDSGYTELVAPRGSGAILTGAGEVNTLRVEWEGSNEVGVWINGTRVHSFLVAARPSGLSGYAVVVDAAESFPDIPVLVEFKQTTPILAAHLAPLTSQTRDAVRF